MHTVTDQTTVDKKKNRWDIYNPDDGEVKENKESQPGKQAERKIYTLTYEVKWVFGPLSDCESCFLVQS